MRTAGASARMSLDVAISVYTSSANSTIVGNTTPAPMTKPDPVSHCLRCARARIAYPVNATTTTNITAPPTIKTQPSSVICSACGPRGSKIDWMFTKASPRTLESDYRSSPAARNAAHRKPVAGALGNEDCGKLHMKRRRLLQFIVGLTLIGGTTAYAAAYRQ